MKGIEEKMEAIDEYFYRLERVRSEAEGISLEESEENLVRKIVSAAIDIASRIVSLEGGGRPDSLRRILRKARRYGRHREWIGRRFGGDGEVQERPI